MSDSIGPNGKSDGPSFEHRFIDGKGIEGHNLGNLLIAALTDITGDFVGAIKEVSKVLAVQGRVLPATVELVTLGATMMDGTQIMGRLPLPVLVSL